MPNWCSNSLTITGHKYDIEAIVDRLKNGDKDKMFETLIGLNPNKSKEEHENDWYSENVNRFGTKWDISYDLQDMGIGKEEIVYHFETAWAPPIDFCRTLSKLYNVQCVLTYSEPGVSFAGQFTCDAEGEMDDECEYLEGLYKYDNECFWNEVESYRETYAEDGNSVEEYLSMFVGVVTDEELSAIKTEYEEELENYKS